MTTFIFGLALGLFLHRLWRFARLILRMTDEDIEHRRTPS